MLSVLAFTTDPDAVCLQRTVYCGTQLNTGTGMSQMVLWRKRSALCTYQNCSIKVDTHCIPASVLLALVLKPDSSMNKKKMRMCSN